MKISNQRKIKLENLKKVHGFYFFDRDFTKVNEMYTGPLNDPARAKLYRILEILEKRLSAYRVSLFSTNKDSDHEFDFNNVLNDFKEYYLRNFQSDLLSYYTFKPLSAEKNIAFSLHCYREYNKDNKLPRISPKHLCFFSLSVYFVSLYPQILGSLFGENIMEDCMECSGFPWLNCGMGGLLHPIRILFESDLLPDDSYIALETYLFVFNQVRNFTLEDFLDFYDGKHENLNEEAYQRVCDVIHDTGCRRLIKDESYANFGIFRMSIMDPNMHIKPIMTWDNDEL